MKLAVPILPPLFFLMFIGYPVVLPAQLITMSNKCYKQVQEGKAAVAAKNHRQALDIFERVLDKCSAKDAQQEANIGKAQAYNGMGKPQEAITAAEAALEVNKDNILALFERATAYHALGDMASAENDLDRILELTEKNQHTSSRATIYAKLAELEWQQGMREEAFQSINTAITTDPSNLNFYLLRGDMYAEAGNLDLAFEDYDRAIEMGENDQEMYVTRSNALIRGMQEKYETDNASQLNAKMTTEEKEDLCRELNKAFELGLKDLELDLFRNMICK